MNREICSRDIKDLYSADLFTNLILLIPTTIITLCLFFALNQFAKEQLWLGAIPIVIFIAIIAINHFSKLNRIKKGGFIIKEDVLSSKDTFHSTRSRSYVLDFSKYGKYNDRYVRYPSCDFYPMTMFGIFGSSECGDWFYVVLHGRTKKIIAVYNQKYFQWDESEISGI